MGLKSGSRDAELDDADEGEGEPESEPEPETGRTPGSERSIGDATAETSGGPTTVDDGGRPSMSSIPYVLRRDKVNEGRDQVPFFLRDEVIEGEADLQDSLESMLGEEVYKSDYREAAMVVAQRKPELVAEVLREWGYDLD